MKDILNKFKILFYNPIIVYLLLIIGISLVAITSSAPLTEIQYGASDYAMRQGLFYGIGFILTFIIIIIGTDRIRALRWWLYGFVMILLFGLFIHEKGIMNVPFAKNINGATCWYILPGIGTLQPSEFMKIALALVVADIIQKHNEFYPHLKRTVKTDFLLLLKIGAAIVPPAFLIFEQPDSGVTDSTYNLLEA